jgi:hypothetical protein
MPKAIVIIALSFHLLLSACSLQQFSSSPADLKLLPPDEVPAELLVKQKLSLLAGEKQEDFILVARFEKQRVKLVLLSAVGLQLLMLDYDGENLVQEIHSSINIPGRDLLAVIQFAMWPDQSIYKHYPEKEGWQVRIEPEKRILLTAGEPLLKIIYGLDSIDIDSYIHDYQVRVLTFEKIPL